MRSLLVYIFPALIVSCIMFARAQVPAANPDNIRFIALDEHQRRNAVLEIRNSLNYENSKDIERIQAIFECDKDFQANTWLKDDMEQLRALVLLRTKNWAIINEISEANRRQLKLINLIDNAFQAGELPPQVANYLKEAKNQVVGLGKRQEMQEKELRKFDQRIQLACNNVPLPQFFVLSSGISMRLCMIGEQAFYVSAKPISTAQYHAVMQAHNGNAAQFAQQPPPDFPAKTDITWAEANIFCRLLGDFEGRAHRLPTISFALPNDKELIILSQISKKTGTGTTDEQKQFWPELAVWINSPQTPSDLETEQSRKRFNVPFSIVWDPNLLLANGDNFGELPLARYPQLGFIVVTPSVTARAIRWQRLRQLMNTGSNAQPVDAQPVDAQPVDAQPETKP